MFVEYGGHCECRSDGLMFMKTLKFALCILTLLATQAARSSIYSLTYNYSFPSGDAASYSNAVYVAQLNLSGSDYVVDVIYNFTGSITGSGSVKNTSTSGKTVFASSSQGADLTATVNATGDVVNEIFQTVHPFSVNTSIPAKSTNSFSGVVGSFNINNIITDPSVIANFLGIQSGSTTGFSGSTGLSYDSSVTVVGTFSITYDVVPEPATWLSAGLLVGFVVVGSTRSLLRKKS